MEEQNTVAKKRKIYFDPTIYEQEKWFDFFKKLPIIVFIITLAITFIWSIVDVAVFCFEIPDRYTTIKYYGVMMVSSPILSVLIWWAIGTVSALIQYVVLKIILSYPILHITYLKSIREECWTISDEVASIPPAQSQEKK